MKIKTTKERNIFEVGFEEGYKVAKRLYKPISINTVTQSDLDVHNHLKKKKSTPSTPKVKVMNKETTWKR